MCILCRRYPHLFPRCEHRHPPPRQPGLRGALRLQAEGPRGAPRLGPAARSGSRGAPAPAPHPALPRRAARRCQAGRPGPGRPGGCVLPEAGPQRPLSPRRKAARAGRGPCDEPAAERAPLPRRGAGAAGGPAPRRARRGAAGGLGRHLLPKRLLKPLGAPPTRPSISGPGLRGRDGNRGPEDEARSSFSRFILRRSGRLSPGLPRGPPPPGARPPHAGGKGALEAQAWGLRGSVAAGAL